MANQRLHQMVLACSIGVALCLGACTRSASTPPAATGQSVEETPSGLNAQQATMEAVRSSLLTQTAQAQPTGGTTPTEAAPTEGATAVVLGTPLGTTAPITVSTATPGRPSTYTLHEGEHPYCIARRFDVDPGELMSANGLTGGSIVSPGQVLTIPSGASSFPPPRALLAHPTTYTVQAGDTIYSIACEFGDVDPNAIAQANGLSDPYTVTAGTVLNIP
jgi:LysM repeat protein